MSDKERDDLLKKIEELTQKYFPDLLDSPGVPAIPDDDADDWDNLDNHVILTDEDGNDVAFEFLDVVEYNGSEYVVLLPVENIEGGEVVLMRVEGEGEDETYISLDDEAEATAVFNAFREKAKNDFNFL